MNAVIPLPPPSQYPHLYTAARAALFRCDQIDECQQWANKANALASYARQSKDESLKDMAARIQARAVRRCGELLGQIPANRGGHHAQELPSRKSAARAAGIDRVQQRQAVAVANIPVAKFEAIVEGDSPPKVYRLAEMGVRKRGRQVDQTKLTMLRGNVVKAEARAQKLTNKLAEAIEAVSVARAALAAYEAA